MSRNYSRAAADGARKRRRRNSLLVSAVAVIVIITLLALEQVALLYLISTLGVVALQPYDVIDVSDGSPWELKNLPGTLLGLATSSAQNVVSYGSVRIIQ